MQRKRLHLNDLQSTDKQIEAYFVLEIENIIIKQGRSLQDIETHNTLMRNVGIA